MAKKQSKARIPRLLGVKLPISQTVEALSQIRDVWTATFADLIRATRGAAVEKVDAVADHVEGRGAPQA